LLGDGEVASSDGEVVIGGEECDQAEGEATDGLGDTELVQSEGAEAEAAGASPREQKIC
jgi:hypothetical protein